MNAYTLIFISISHWHFFCFVFNFLHINASLNRVRTHTHTKTYTTNDQFIGILLRYGSSLICFTRASCNLKKKKKRFFSNAYGKHLPRKLIGFYRPVTMLKLFKVYCAPVPVYLGNVLKY